VIRSAATFLVCIQAVSVLAQTAPSTDVGGVASLVAAERAFAKRSVDTGMKPAFLANLADDAIIFRPGPVPGLAWFKDHGGAQGTLDWAPDLAAVANTGDLGYTSGPWSYTEEGKSIYGHFATVWRRDDDGAWKVVADNGARHEEVKLALSVVVPDWATQASDTDVRVASQKALSIGSEADLLATDRAFGARVAKEGWAAALASCVASDIRWCRPGALPVSGRTRVLEAVASRRGKASCTSLAARVSRGDLGYTYGTTTFHPEGTPADSTESLAYLRIWRIRDDGKRVIVLEAANPMPAKR